MNKLIHTGLLTFTLIVAGASAALAFTDGAAVLEAIKRLGFTTWAIILGLSLINYLLRYFRWHWYLRADIPPTLSHSRHLFIYIAGFALTMTPGKAGEAMRCLYLKKQGVSNDKSMGIFVVERLLDLLVIILMAAAVVSIFSTGQAVISIMVSLGLIAIALGIVHLPKEKLLGSKPVRRLPEKIQQALRFAESSLDAARSHLAFKPLLFGLFLGIIAWGLEGVGLYLVMEAFDVEKSSVLIAIGIYGFAILLGALSFLPGGIGGAEAAMIFLLIKTGFSAPEAFAITIICRIATLWFAILLGVISTTCLSLEGFKPAFKR